MDDPLPDEDVDLFVDNIERENAEAILLLDRTGGTIVVERTLGYLGKYLGHGIRPIFGLHLWVSHHVPAVVPELVAQEEVGEVDLAQDVGEVEELAEEEPEGVEAVGAAVEAPVPDDIVDLGLKKKKFISFWSSV